MKFEYYKLPEGGNIDWSKKDDWEKFIPSDCLKNMEAKTIALHSKINKSKTKNKSNESTLYDKMARVIKRINIKSTKQFR